MAFWNIYWTGVIMGILGTLAFQWLMKNENQSKSRTTKKRKR